MIDTNAKLRSAAAWSAATLTALALLLLAAAPALGQPIRRIAQNPRGLALGGTGMSYADDEMGLYYNPAGLAAASDTFWFELLPLALEASPDGQEFIQDKLNSQDSDLGSLSGVADLIQENIGKDIHFRALVYPTAVIGFGDGVTLGFGGYWEAEVDLLFRNLATPEADAFFRKDTGMAGALSFPLGDGKFVMGLGVRTIDRTIGEGVITAADLFVASRSNELDLEQVLNVQEGTGTGYDLGMIMRLEAFPSLRSQLALVVQNVGGVDLGKAGEIEQEIGIGWAARPQFSSLVNGLIAIEYRDVAKALTDDSSDDKRTHIGLEVGIIPLDNSTNLVTLRTGFGSGLFSWGFELAFWHSFSIQFVSYGQEYGEVAGDDPRDRRILQINFLGF